MAELAVALVPAAAGQVLDVRGLGGEAAAWAYVLPRVRAAVSVPEVLLEVLGGCRVYWIHGCLDVGERMVLDLEDPEDEWSTYVDLDIGMKFASLPV